MKVVYRIGLVIAVLACCASLIPTVASAAYLPPIPSSHHSAYYGSYRTSYSRPSYPSYYGQLNRAGFGMMLTPGTATNSA